MNGPGPVPDLECDAVRPNLPRPLLPLALLGGCAGAEGARPTFVPGFVERSVTAECEAIPPPGGVLRSVGAVRVVGDSALVVLHTAEREVAVYDDRGGESIRVRYEREGPSRVLDPQDVTWHEGRFHVADRAARRVKILRSDGGEAGEVRLPFAPERVAVVGGGLLVVPLVLGAGEEELLHRWDGIELRPLGVPVVRLGDWRLEAMANQATLVAYPDGRAVLAHQVVVPRAHVVEPGGSEARTTPLPLPDGVRGAFGRLPASPLTEEELRALPAAVFDGAADPRSGDFLYLTRTGRRMEEHAEKAVIRVDRDFRYVRSYLLPVNAGFLGYFASSGASLVVDEADRWHRCSTP